MNAIGADQAHLVLTGKRPITTSCGSGMTAGILWLGLKLLGAPNLALYDEVCSDQARRIQPVINTVPQSWTGYASRAESPIEKST